MFEQLQKLWHKIGNLDPQDVNSTDWGPLLTVLAISGAAALLLSLLYSLFFERRATGSDVHRAFPVLGIAITAIFICLQHSLPMSLGLLGALSIVRFRTPIKEPEEIGFLMVLIATSICCATINFSLLTIVLSLTLGTLILMRVLPWFRRSRGALGSLLVTIDKQHADAALAKVMELTGQARYRAALDGVTDCDGACTISVTLFRGDATSLGDLHQQLRAACPDGDVSLFLNRPRPIGGG
ncbi:MAG: DUF4956 domain-containing protein [Planctomycetes bacterium]|nr:DUF4956 domain-containing protein [Planctomycetota bacterium]